MCRVLLVLALASVACGGAQADDPVRIVVPPQPSPAPPSPEATAPAPVPTAVVALAAPPLECAQGASFTVDDRGYCAYPDPMRWEDAEARCVKTGGHLMALETKEESEAVHLALGSPVRAGRAAWIGLESPAKVKTGWRWTTGETVTDASWNAGEPNNWDGNEACAEWLFANGRWNDTRCKLEQPFLCQQAGDKRLDCTGHPVTGEGGVAYCYVGREVTQPEAKAACKRMGGRLASPKTARENEALRAAMAQRFVATRMWIGLNDRARQGAWVWANQGDPRFTAWEPGEPNAFGREACVELFADRWTWNDLDCEQRLPSVCEGPARAP